MQQFFCLSSKRRPASLRTVFRAIKGKGDFSRFQRYTISFSLRLFPKPFLRKTCLISWERGLRRTLLTGNMIHDFGKEYNSYLGLPSKRRPASLRTVFQVSKMRREIFTALPSRYQLRSPAVPKAFSAEDLSDPLGTRPASHPSHRNMIHCFRRKCNCFTGLPRDLFPDRRQ